MEQLEPETGEPGIDWGALPLVGPTMDCGAGGTIRTGGSCGRGGDARGVLEGELPEAVRGACLESASCRGCRSTQSVDAHWQSPRCSSS